MKNFVVSSSTNHQEKRIHITLYVIIHALCDEHILSLEYVPWRRSSLMATACIEHLAAFNKRSRE